MLQYKDLQLILLGLAMIKIDKILEEKQKAKMLLQIHDELIFECLKKDEEQSKKNYKRSYGISL